MSENVLLIDLGRSEYEYLPYSYRKERLCGRSLVLDLFKRFLSDGTGRYDPANLIVLAPGLFAGTPAPSACRMTVATVSSHDRGLQICNTTGNMPQKLGSLGIAAVVICGRAPEKNSCINISAEGVEFYADCALEGARNGEIIRKTKERFGRDCAIVGSGIAGDMRLSLSTFFCTYPDGDPEYHCPRYGFGDVWASKNLRALSVCCDDYFGRECRDPEEFVRLGRILAKRITNDGICGSALPTYGSITIMKILKSRGSIAELSLAAANDGDAADGNKADNCGIRQNKTCAPMCVIGCLNRHSAAGGRQYSNPAQIETQAAIEKCFGIDDHDLADVVQREASEIGLVATEFVTACKAYAECLGIEHGEEHLTEWLAEIEKGSLTGRVIASRTHGVSDLFADKDLEDWIDRSAVQDEDEFDVKMNTGHPQLPEMSALETLYSQIFILEDLGFCIFTSFALLDRAETFDIMAGMVNAMTGAGISGAELIIDARNCIRMEREYSEHRWKAVQKDDIPPFTRVLYRYFDGKDRD